MEVAFSRGFAQSSDMLFTETIWGSNFDRLPFFEASRLFSTVFWVVLTIRICCWALLCTTTPLLLSLLLLLLLLLLLILLTMMSVPLHFFWCDEQLLRSLKARPHLVQANGLSPVWVRKWESKTCLWAKNLLQYGQECTFLPECMFKWHLMLYRDV